MSAPGLVNTPGINNKDLSADVIDGVLEIDSGHPLYDIRRGRTKVVVAMQKNYDTFFGPEAGGLSQQDRLKVAWFACALSKCTVLQQHYAKRLSSLGIAVNDLPDLLDENGLDNISDQRLRVILFFTQKLILNPVEGDEQEIKKLRDAGVTTEDIVTLAQLIAFLSYQIRVVVGFLAMKERLEK